MRKLFTFSIFIVITSCLSETDVNPGNSGSFVRYFNGGNNDEARSMELAPDGGYILLATTRIQKTEAEIPLTKVKVIKTDKNGNPLWQRLYPGFTIKDRDYAGSAIQVNPAGGYVVVGDRVLKSTGIAETFVFTINEDGVPQDSAFLSFNPGVAENGKAVAVEADGDFLVLSTSGTDHMNLTEINKDTFVPSTPIAYFAGVTKLANRLLLDGNGNAVWSGMRTVSGLTGIRLLKVAPSSPTAEWDQFLNEPGYSLSGFDFCPYGTGYVIAGSTNKKPDGSVATDTDILFYKVTAGGTILPPTNSFPFDNPDTPENEDNQIDAGNSITATMDGGLIFLSSVNSVAIAGRGDSDFYLIKVNGFGEKEWTSSFGSKFKDEGVAIRQTSEGSYVALGTTTQGALKILTLFKTNKVGKIE